MNADNLVKNIKRYFKENNFKKAVIGLSGGIDSSVCCVLAVKALGKGNVTAVLMPEKGITKKENVADAKELAEKIGIKYYIQPINEILNAYKKDFVFETNKLAEINLKARIRANLLYSFANSNNALVIGTSNKSELLMGYGTKYGDLACDVMLVGSLYKTQVIALAKLLKLPKKIIEKKPTAELYKGQFDENELGISYEELDERLMSGKLNSKLKKRIEKNRHKSNIPRVIDV